MQQKKASSWLKMSLLGTAVMATSLAAAPGCLDRPIEPVEPRTTTTIVERLTQSSVDKIDLLLVIDNSRSMADKQEILSLAVPDLVNELLNPRCLNEDGTPAQQQPADPLQDCPIEGTKREFDPILDIHIGIITSSIGGHGADACNLSGNFSEDDKGHLINRSGTGASDPPVPTYQDRGYLVWDPDSNDPSHDPQGETDQANLITNITAMVSGAGEVGCGYEATLEAWFRFLVDPDPYETIVLEDNKAVLQGTDNVLLTQRKQFMRPDSLLAIIMLSDENDCSIRDGGQYYFAAQIYQPGTNNPYHLPKARAACASDPNDPCCKSCGQPAGECDDSADDCSGALPAIDDDINLRCYDQKRRFGIDFLYPVDRYVQAVTQTQVTNRFGDVVANPLFQDLDPDDDNSAVRDPGLVFVAGIVGVPWQDIARQTDDGTPDLLTGKNAEGEAVGGFQSGVELALNNTWDVILGDPSCYHTDSSCLPTDPLMRESVDPRTGQNPVTGDQVGLTANNSINGHEYSIPAKNDLQYACIFDLQATKDCATETICDCQQPGDNPLCETTIGSGTFTQTQERAKAYPGVRELQVLKNVGTQGIVGSICPQQQVDATLANYGYRPAVKAIVDRLKQALGGQCLPRSLTPDAAGQVQCKVLEARVIGEPGQCEAVCNSPGRSFIPQDDPAVKAAQQDELAQTAGWNCFCLINQLTDEELNVCQNDISDVPVTSGGDAVHGWCYVDASRSPAIGNPDIVANCPETEKRIIRFVGDGQGAPGATLFITCAGE